jgi:signal transduction histidine kinase
MEYTRRMSRIKIDSADYLEADEQIMHLVKDLPEIELARAILTTVSEPLMILDGQMRIKWANKHFYANFRSKPEDTEGRLIYEFAEGQWNIGKIRELFDKVTQGRGRVSDYRFTHYLKGVGHKSFNMNASTIFSETGDPQLVLLSIQDITERTDKDLVQKRLIEQVQDRAVHLEKAKEDLRSEIIEQLEQNNIMVQAQEELEKSEEDRAAELVVAKELIKEEILEHWETEDELREAGRIVQNLSSKLLFAIENERKSIAMELHDSIGASLTAIIYGLEEALENATVQQSTQLREVLNMTKETVEETRRIRSNLRPSILDDLGILATINWFIRQFQSLYDSINIEQQIEVQEGEVAEPLKIAIFRILQEALNNAAKHSEADTVRVSLRQAEEVLELAIVDNGRGFDVGTLLHQSESGTGMGLESMKERTELLGGSFAIGSKKGKGTVVRASWPLSSTYPTG